MNKDIILLANSRESSTRCKNKMFRKFGDTTLVDILLNKFESINRTTNIFDKIIFAAYPGDTRIWDIASKYDLRVEERNEFSARHGKLLSDIHHYLDDYDQKYVMWINGCLPFLRKDTIIDAATLFKECDYIKGLHPVKRRYNWFWREDLPINVIDKTYTRTQDSGEIYESTQAFHVFNREYMLKNNAYWNMVKNDPYLYKVDDSIEFFDINTELDFIIGQNIYESKDNWCR